MIEKDFDEKIFEGTPEFFSQLLNSYHPDKKIRVLRNISLEMIKELCLDISTIAQRKHQPYRKRFMPLNYGKKPSELIIVPKNKEVDEMGKGISKFLKENYPYVNFETGPYLGSEAFYLSVNGPKYLKSTFKNYWKDVLKRVH